MNPSPRLLPSAEELKSILDYNPETGEFRWKDRRGNRFTSPGMRAGTLNRNGYSLINIGGTPMLAHRIAWVMVNGYWPPVDIDHINGIPGDNRICNLRLATREQNQRNQKVRRDNTSGHKGVYWHATMKKWMAYINHGGKMRIIGYDADISKAAAMRREVEAQIFREFARKIDPA